MGYKTTAVREGERSIATTTHDVDVERVYSVVTAEQPADSFERNTVVIIFDQHTRIEARAVDGKPALQMIDADGRALAAALVRHYEARDAEQE